MISFGFKATDEGYRPKVALGLKLASSNSSWSEATILLGIDAAADGLKTLASKNLGDFIS